MNGLTNEFSPAVRTSNQEPYALIMKGGGVKGLAYIGALKELERYYHFNWFIGTSAGAIAAALLAAGYSSQQLEQELVRKDFRDFLDARFYQWPTNLMFHKGLYPARRFNVWLDKLLAQKLDSPINVMLERMIHRITIYACRRGKNALIFDSTQAETRRNPASYAVRCSMSIPLVFTPQSDKGMRVFDGGMRNNYPVDILLQSNPNTKFIGLYLGPELFEGEEKEPSLLKEWISIWKEAIDLEALEKYESDTVIIDPRPISTIDFSLSASEKEFLLKAGRAAALKFLFKKSEDEKQRLGATNITPEMVEQARTEAKQCRTRVEGERKQRRKKATYRNLGILFVLLMCAVVIRQWPRSISQSYSAVGNLFSASVISPSPSPSTTSPTNEPTPLPVVRDKDENPIPAAKIPPAVPSQTLPTTTALQQGKNYYNKGNYAAAITELNKAIASKPDDAEAYFYRGDSHYERREYAEAIKDYSDAIRRDYKDVEVYFQRGNARYESGKINEAIQDYSVVIARKPDKVVYYNRGTAYQRINQCDPAISDFTHAIQLKIDNLAEVYKLRAECYEKKQDKRRARQDYQQVINLEKDSEIKQQVSNALKRLSGN